MDHNSNTVKVVRTAAKFVVGVGASKITHQIISNNVNTPTTRFSKVTMMAGAAMIAWVVSNAAEQAALDFIDDTIDFVNSVKDVVRPQVPDTPETLFQNPTA